MNDNENWNCYYYQGTTCNTVKNFKSTTKGLTMTLYERDRFKQ